MKLPVTYLGRHLSPRPWPSRIERAVATVALVALVSTTFGVVTSSQALDFPLACTTVSATDGAALATAVSTANANGLDDTITLTAGCVYALTTTLTISSDSSHSLTIVGNGSTIKGDPGAFVVQIASGATATIGATTITDGNGGVDNQGTLTLTNSTVTGNDRNGHAGGIDNQGTLTITGSTISNNTSTGVGAGIWNRAGSATITDTTITGNSTPNHGGGIDNRAPLTLTNSTISDNTGDGGAGIINYSTLQVTGSTIRNNKGTHYGPGINNNGSGSTATVTNTTIADNSTTNHAGGIYNGGTLTVTGSTVSGNRSGGVGGGIWNNGGTANVTESTISGNSTNDHGGGIDNRATLTLTRSTVSGNSAGGVGGALFNYGGTASITNSTIGGNTAGSDGGGIDNRGPLTLLSSTIAYNEGNGGSGIHDTSNDLTINNTIVSNNTRGVNCSGTFVTSANNLSDTAACGTGFTEGNPLLDELANNGGPTQTMAIDTGSPAIGAGASCPTTDQRGIVRSSYGACDIGAFELESTYSLRVTKLADGTGTVTSNDTPQTINCGSTCRDTSYAGTETLTLTASPDSTSFFTGWSGACSGTGTCVVTVNGNKRVKATFVLKEYPLTVTRSGNGSGTVTSDPVGIDCGSTCSDVVNRETVVSLSAQASGGSAFARWTGACTGSTTCEVTMTSAKTVNAVFVTPTAVSCAASALASAVSTANGNNADDVLSLTGGCTYNLTSTLTIDSDSSHSLRIEGNGATLDAGDSFTGVRINSGADLTLNDTTVTRGAGTAGLYNSGTLAVTDSTITDNHGSGAGGIRNDNALSVTRTTVSDNSSSQYGPGIYNGGTATVTDSTISGNSSNDHSGGLYNANTLTVTGTTITGNYSGGFGAGIWNSSGTTTVTNSTITGNTSASTGSGVFSWGTAMHIVNSTIAGNSGTGPALNRNNGTMTVKNSIVSGNTGGNCTGTFATSTNNMSNTSGCGTGFTVSDPLLDDLGNNGGSTETMALNDGSPALNAAEGTLCPATDQRGIGRPQGVGCDIGAFELDTAFSLRVTKLGDGTGTVTSSDSNINCGNACRYTGYSGGENITLQAAADASSTFTGWAGACLGVAVNDPCPVAINGNKKAKATFVLKAYPLTVNKTGTGGGTVTSDVGGINCGSTCNATINRETTVTLEAEPNGSSAFGGWTGACSGFLTCTVTMTVARTVTASFVTPTAVACGTSNITSAVTTANSNNADDALSLAEECTYNLTDVLQINSDSNHSLTIIGNGSVLDGDPTKFVVQINGSATASINDTTVRGGNGGINNTGKLTLIGSTVSGNTRSDHGAGVLNTGTLIVNRSTIENNTSAGQGAGIYNPSWGPGITVIDSTISNNTSQGAGNGAGIFVDGGTSTITGSTIDGNTGTSSGGGIHSGGTLTLTNSTITNNFTTSQGGGIYNSGTLTVKNTTIAANNSNNGARGLHDDGTAHVINTIVSGNGTDNCDGTFETSTNNISNTNVCGGGFTTGDPLLQALAYNGGMTWTMGLGAGSAAIDAGDDVSCPTTDQRGYARPIGSHCDAGAFESGSAGPPSPSPSPSASPSSSPSASPSSSPSASPSSSPSASPSASPSGSPSPSPTPTEPLPDPLPNPSPSPTATPTPPPISPLPACVDDPDAICFDDGDSSTDLEDQTIYLLPGAGHVVIRGGGNIIIISPDFTGVLTIEGDNNSVSGGDGDEVMWVNGCGSSILGGDGSDRIIVRCEATDLSARAGDAEASRSVIEGGDGDDVIRVHGEEADIYGALGDDRLQGGAGLDRIFGGPGRDVLQGRDGDDDLHGGPGADKIVGGPDDDWIVGGWSYDYIYGGIGWDLMRYNRRPNHVRGIESLVHGNLVSLGGAARKTGAAFLL